MPEPFDPSAFADPAARAAALEAFASRAAAADAVRAAAACLTDVDAGVRERAARLLTTRGDAEAARAAAPFIASRDLRVRNLAGEVLSGLGAHAVDALAPVIEDADKDVRKFAIDILALLPAQPLRPRIAACLDDDDLNVVVAAIDALGALGPTPHAERLRALYDEAPLVRPSVVMALGAEDPACAATLDLFARALDDENPVVQFAAADALAAQRAPAALGRLAALVPVVSPAARPLVLSAVVRLLRDAPERANAHDALRPHLVAMLDDLDVAYRCAAVDGLTLLAGAGAGMDDGLLDALLVHAGEDDDLDVAIFGAVAGEDGVLARLFHLTHTSRLAAQTATHFALGLLAQGFVDEANRPGVAAFIGTHFAGLDADTKFAAIDVAQRIQHPTLHAVIRAGLADLDPTVRSFAADAARSTGLDHRAASASHRALA